MRLRRRGFGGQQRGVSVVTVTNRPHFLMHMLQNYKRQTWRKKEWIIVVNKDHVDLSRYYRMAGRLDHIRVYHLPARHSLGRCLNFASAQARFPFIAKMDDDEYYAPQYLTSMMHAFRRSHADVVGKRAYFIYLSGKNVLIQRFTAQNRFVPILAGGTLVYKRRVWKRVRFANRSLGEDVRFCWACRRHGFRLYAADRYNFCAVRRRNPNSHTWKNSDQAFLNHPKTRVIAYGGNYKQLVARPVKP